MKELKDISWLVSEPEYREDKALSYSTLAKFEREGFNNLDKLFDRIETPSLLLGSMVDTYITDGEEAYFDTYIVAELPSIPDSIISIVKDLFDRYNESYRSLLSIPDVEIIEVASIYNYQNNWKPETRAKVIREKGVDYYDKLFISIDKTLVSQELHDTAMAMCDVLKNSEATSFYFAPNNPFDEDIKRYYQLKFKATLNGINYRCMFDELIVDYKNKLIQPIDLKTSSHYEDEFFESFRQWLYNIQARLYVRILQEVISKDDYFKDFTILPYKFIVVNKKKLYPLVWDFKETFHKGLLTYGKHQQIEFRDPEEIGKELNYYLNSNCKVPIGINVTSGNDIGSYLNKI